MAKTTKTQGIKTKEKVFEMLVNGYVSLTELSLNVVRKIIH